MHDRPLPIASIRQHLNQQTMCALYRNHFASNSIYAAVLWSIWKFRNAIIFNCVTWLDIKQMVLDGYPSTKGLGNGKHIDSE